jgi:hypothetical protein
MGIEQTGLVFRKRLTLGQYGRLPAPMREVIDFTIASGVKPNKIMRIRSRLSTREITPKNENLWTWSWGEIEILRSAIMTNNISAVFELAYGITAKDLAKVEMFNAFACYKWVVKQMEQIAEVEMMRLSSELTSEEKDAGYEDLQEFGYSVALSGLAQRFLDQEKILKKPYQVVFKELCLQKKLNEISKTYQENASRKSRINSRGA